MVKYDFSARKAQLVAVVKAAEGVSDRKSPERKAAARAMRKLNQLCAFEDILEQLPKDATVTSETAEYIQSLSEEYVPGVKLNIQAGDDLIEILEEYKDVKDLYKKVLKWCDKNGCEIKGTKIVKK